MHDDDDDDDARKEEEEIEGRNQAFEPWEKKLFTHMLFRIFNMFVQ